MWRDTFLLILLVSGSAGRKSVGRGQSGARGGVGGQPPQGGFNPNQGNFNPNQGFHPNPNQGGFHPNQGGFHPNQGGFHPNQGGAFGPSRSSFSNAGSGLGSRKSSSNFKTALAAGALGAVGGIVAYEAGKAIIKSATEPFHYQGRNYYWGDDVYRNQQGQFMCTIPLSDLQQVTVAPTTTTTTTSAPSDNSTTSSTETTTTKAATPNGDNLFNTIQFHNGTRPKMLAWGCRAGAEICCGTECCPNPNQQTARPSGSSTNSGLSSVATTVLLILLVLLLISCCCCFFLYKSIASCVNSALGREDKEYAEEPHPMQPYPQQYQQGYPNQGGYPPQGGYPQQGYPQQGYVPQQYPQYPQQQQYHQY